MFADPLFILEKLRDRISSPQKNFNSSPAGFPKPQGHFRPEIEQNRNQNGSK